MTGVTFSTAFLLKYSAGKVTLMSADTVPLFSTSTSGVQVSFTSSMFLAIFLKQLQLVNANEATASARLNFINFFIIVKIKVV